MTTPSMQEQIEGLDGSTDWSDPTVYERVLSAQADGIDDQVASPGQPQGDTPAAPAPSDPPAAADPAPAAASPVPAAPAAPAPAPASADAVDGVLTRDGKHVIPYGVLDAARTTARREAERSAQLLATVERLQNELTAKSAAPAPAPKVELSAEELADLQDLPGVAKLVSVVNDLAGRVAQAPAQPAPAPAPAATTEQDAFDAGISANPLIAQWMADGARGASPQWDRACELDAALRADPKYAARSYADRFAAVQTLVAAEFGIAPPVRPATPAPSPTPASPAAASPAAPARSAPHTPIEAPEPSLDDLAGQVPSTEQDRWAALNERDALAAAHGLTDAQLRAMAGITY